MPTEAKEVRAIATVQYGGMTDDPHAAVSKSFASRREALDWAQTEVEGAHGAEVWITTMYDSLGGNAIWLIRSTEGPTNALIWDVPFPAADPTAEESLF